MASDRSANVVLVASGDLRETANRLGWPAQAELEAARRRRRSPGTASRVRRAHPVDDVARPRLHLEPADGHGRLRRASTADAPLIVAEAVWQYSHHVLPGLRRHRGPILTVANWSGTWPGLVGHAQPQRLADQGGRRLLARLERGLHRRRSPTRRSRAGSRPGASSTTRRHVRDLDASTLPGAERRSSAAASPASSRDRKAILGVFDEGCMGMFNAIIPDELLNPTGHLQGAAQPVGARRRDAAR